MLTDSEREALWDAIRRYAIACGAILGRSSVEQMGERLTAKRDVERVIAQIELRHLTEQQPEAKHDR